MPFSPSGKKERKIAERSVVEAHSRETSLIHINIFLLRIKHSLEQKHRETHVIQEKKLREKERKAEIQNTKFERRPPEISRQKRESYRTSGRPKVAHSSANFTTMMMVIPIIMTTSVPCILITNTVSHAHPAHNPQGALLRQAITSGAG